MSICRVISCIVGKGCLLWPVHSLGKTQLAFILLHFVLQGQSCLLLQVSLDCLLLHPSPLFCNWLLFCCWERVFAITSAFFWQNSVSLCPASFCTPRPNLSVTSVISWLPTFAFQCPMMQRTSFFFFSGVSSRRSFWSSKNHSTSASLALVFGPWT